MGTAHPPPRLPPDGVADHCPPRSTRTRILADENTDHYTIEEFNILDFRIQDRSRIKFNEITDRYTIEEILVLAMEEGERWELWQRRVEDSGD